MQHWLSLLAVIVLIAWPAAVMVRADDCPEYYVYIIPPGEVVSTTTHCCQRVIAFPSFECDLVTEPCESEFDSNCPTKKWLYLSAADAQCLGWTTEGGFECVATTVPVLESTLVGCRKTPFGCDCDYSEEWITLPTTLPQPCEQ